MTQYIRWVAILSAVIVALVLLSATAASAHPLGNFSVNVHSALVLRPDGVQLSAVTDSAEIPTRQAKGDLDADGNGELGDDELAPAADRRCHLLAGQLVATIGDSTLDWEVKTTSLVAEPGAAGLPTLRLECDLWAARDLSSPTTLRFEDRAGDGRVGWHEITATGDGVELVDPAVDATSISDELRDYPDELLASPLDQREAVIEVRPGRGGPASDALGIDTSGGGNALTRAVATGDRLLQDTIGREDLTVVIGALAVLLAMLLGAGHAVLPGHGKTVMAAYLAGRRGTRTDALIVGATVTVTHTAGVLLLGLALSVGSAIAGEVILDRLGLVSGVLIAGIGIGMLRDALRGGRADAGKHHHHGPGHAHTHTEHDPPGEHHVHDATTHDHHDGSHNGPVDHTAGQQALAAQAAVATTAVREPEPQAAEDIPDPRFSRGGLIGMAMAGGLVPSPSALVVLLGSVALGRTVLGVSLVLAYGLGMAATLTAVGLLLVRLRDRFDHVRSGRIGQFSARVGTVLPALTAGLVLVVGVGLVARSLLT